MVDRPLVQRQSLPVARINVLEKVVNKDCRHASHHYKKWHQIYVPELELEVTTWSEIDS